MQASGPAWVNDPVSRASFLSELHARFGLPRQAVVGLVERATGAGVVDLERLVRGDENEVYRVEVADGRMVYPRIRRPGLGGVDGEVWAMEHARSAGVPVPEVLSVETLGSGDGERYAMVVAAAPGRELANILDSLTAKQRRATMEEIGRVLARSHSVRTADAWRPDRDGAWPDPARWRSDFIAERRADCAHLTTAGFTAGEVDRALGLLTDSSLAPPGSDAPVLCHGDISPVHVFVDDDLHVSSIIDWGMWSGRSPIADLAQIAIHHDAPDFTAIVDGYGGPLQDPAFRQSLCAWTVALAVEDLSWHLSVGNGAGLAPNAAAVRWALALADRGGPRR